MDEERIVLYDLDPTVDNQLVLRKGMHLIVTQLEPDGWAHGKDLEAEVQGCFLYFTLGDSLWIFFLFLSSKTVVFLLF